ncbi:integrase core domain-containing protein [Caldimonas tepidiphila]|uniref:integrase core domain-containing protein n=1 Tax=Caldimonas tepidiphila TaxID=2315841 RepID=UPI003012FE6D
MHGLFCLAAKNGNREWQPGWHRDGADRSRQAPAERRHRELQRSIPLRMPGAGAVPHQLEARIMIEDWRRHYNEVLPHSSLGYRTPLEFRQQSAPQGKSTEAEVNLPMV